MLHLPNPAFRWNSSSVPSGGNRSPTRPAQAIRDSGRVVGATSSPLGRLAFALFCLFVFAIPWENSLMFPGVLTVSHVLGLIALPVAILAILESRQLRCVCVPLALMALFVAWGSLSFFWTVDPQATTIQTTSWIENLGMVLLILELANRRARQLVLMRAYVLGTLVSSGDTILSYLRRSTAYYERYAASGFDPNELGLLLAMSLPLSLYLSTIDRNRFMVWVYRLQLMMALVAIGLTSSRAALFATLVALLYAPLVLVRVTFRQKCALLLVGAVIISSALAFLPETSWKRWEGVSRELAQGTWGQRKAIWSAGLELNRMYPIAGIGAGAFPAGTERIMGRGIVAHNTFLSVLVEEGVIGLVLFLTVLLSLVLPALQLPSLERDLWLVLFATWVTGVNSLTWETRKPTWLLFGLLAGWLATTPAFRRNTARWPAPTVACRAI
jgi:Lipid A core - O-antigen ligase and related enzymes